MKRTWLGALAAIACATTISLSAQTPPAGGQTPPTGAQTPPASASKMDDKVSVTGCLERAGSASAPTGTSGAAGASAGAKFVLNNASAAGAASTPGTAGTAGASKATASSYQLDGEDSKLTPHVGHKVEISGTVEKAGAGASAAASGGPKLKVDSVKMIASSCTQ